MHRDPGSFKDPAGAIYMHDGRVFRSVTSAGLATFEAVRETGLLDVLVERGMLVPYTVVAAPDAPQIAGAEVVLEHPRIAHISYPYEWSFSMLRAAALFHLDVQLEALDHGVMLSDATAYNIQFDGVTPAFIDHLSFRPYVDGEYWIAHRQFCEQFVCPLLLRHYRGIAHNSWYRGELHGIPLEATAALLPVKAKLSWNVLTHVVAQARLQAGGERTRAQAAKKDRKLPRSALRNMWLGLRTWLTKMRIPDSPTTWSDYAENTSYSDEQTRAKAEFVRDFVASEGPEVVCDLGCNTGAYAAVALAAGARRVIGYDADHGALEGAFERAQSHNLAFTPLYLDATNPPSNQGWNEEERSGFSARADAGAILALALIHHLAIANNVPLDEVVGWLVSLAPRGVLEFVPKSDPMVRELLRLREDIFIDYDEAAFVQAVERRATITARHSFADGGRLLIAFARHAA